MRTISDLLSIRFIAQKRDKLAVKAIIAPVVKSDSMLNLHTDIGAKINKFTENIKSIFNGRDMVSGSIRQHILGFAIIIFIS